MLYSHQYISPLQLISNDDRAQLQANSVYKTSKSSASLKPPGKGRQPRLKVKAVPVPDGTPRVFIDGVTYEFNSGGKGLKRTSGEYLLIDTGTIRICLQNTSNRTPYSGTLTARSLDWSVSSVLNIDSNRTEISPCQNQSKCIYDFSIVLTVFSVPRKGQLCPYFSKTGASNQHVYGPTDVLSPYRQFFVLLCW